MDLGDDAKLFGQFFQMRLERTFARDDELGVGKFLLKNGKGAERSRDPFFRNQPAGLHEAPATVGGSVAADKRKLMQRHAGAVDAQTFRRTAERKQALRQRFRTRQHQRHGVEQILQLRTVIANVLFLRHVRAMKGNDTGLVPAFDERQQMHASVPEINMHQIGAPPFEQPGKHLVFAAVKDRRLLLHKLQPAVAQWVAVRLRDQLDVVKGKELVVLERLGHDERFIFVQRPDLPVNVQHFRLQEGGAVTGYDSFCHGEGRLSVRLCTLSICYSRAGTSSDSASDSWPGEFGSENSQRFRCSFSSANPWSRPRKSPPPRCRESAVGGRAGSRPHPADPFC